MLGDVLELAATQIFGIPADHYQRKLVDRSRQDSLLLSDAGLIHSILLKKARIKDMAKK